MILYCIRHGESAYNAEGRIQGQEDIPLSELGRRQSSAVAAALKDCAIRSIYASPLKRAMETAAPIAAGLGLPVRTDPRLMEIHAGVFQGLLWPEIEQRYPAEAERWRRQEFDFVLPGGESRRQLVARATAVFHDIREQSGGDAVVVSHGGLLSAALKGLLGIPSEFNPFRFYNCALTKLAWEAQVRILYVNRLEHLRGAGLELETKTGDL